MAASKGLRPALLFLSSGAILTTASISARKLSKGTINLSASSGSPLAGKGGVVRQVLLPAPVKKSLLALRGDAGANDAAFASRKTGAHLGE
jgi:hypothetical protein